MKSPSQEDLLYQLVGERIRKTRELHVPKMSQAQLAELLDMSRASVVNVEAGRQHAPLHLLWRVAEVLEISINELFPEPEELAAHLASDSEIDEQLSGYDSKTQRAVKGLMRRAKSKLVNK